MVINSQDDNDNYDEDWRDRNMTLRHKLNERYEQGLRDGRRLALKQIQLGMLINCMKNMGKSFNEACEVLGISQEERDKLKEWLEV